MGTEVENAIIINLQESSNAREYDNANLIHQREFDRVKRLLEERINRAALYKDDSYDNNIPRRRYNDTISILGSRGSGKTSFLSSLLNYCKTDDKLKSKVEVLNIIDPTLIEEKGHIFLTIISLIKEAVHKKLNFNDCIPGDNNYPTMKEWKEKLHKLADGLPSMDGVGLGLTETNWQDAEFIMNRGLKSVKAATNLESNFNDLVNCALKVLKKEAFIITLDDIDVDFRKGWPVLETIRKYLTSAQLIILLSGDLKLFSKAIRKQQWSHFGKALLKNEAEQLKKMNGYNDLVTEMEGQYLQKVMKPENRIHLTTIFEKVNTYSVKINILSNYNSRYEGLDKCVDIKIFYDNILSNFGIRNSSQVEAYRSFLMSLPLRSQIQFLSGYGNPNADITDAFLSDLFEKEVDVDLAKNLPKMLDIVLLKLLINEQILAEAYQLQPVTTDTSLNSSLTALSFLFSQKVKDNPFLIFDYFIKIGYIRNLLGDIGYKNSINKNDESPYSIENLCQSSGIYQDKVLRDVVGNITSYLRGVINFPKENNDKRYAGTIPLTGLARRAKERNIGTRVDEVFKNDPNGFRIASIPLTISSSNWKNSTILTASIYVLIASIGEMVRFGSFKEESISELNDDQNVENKNTIEDRDTEISNLLLELSQIRTYLMPKFNRQDIKFEEEEEEEENTDESDKELADTKNSIKYLARIIRKWIDRYPSKTISVSPHLLGKISTRFFYALDSIESKKEIPNLADALYRRIVAFANAVIIEEIKENLKKNINNKGKQQTTRDLNLDNTITADKIFKNNLKVAEIYKENLLLSRWLLACPLLILYLPQDKEFTVHYRNFISDNTSEENTYYLNMFNHSIYDTLKNVVIRGFEKNKNQPNGINNENNNVNLEGNINNRKPMFRSRDINERVKVLQVLIENNIPSSLFKDEKNRTIIKNLNNDIRNECNDLFDEIELNSDYLREFRKFLKSETANKMDLVKQWKQIQ